MKIVRALCKARKGLRLPFAHMEVLQGIVYRMMSYDEGLSAEIHNKQFTGSKPFKFFCFSDIIGRYRIENKELICGSFLNGKSVRQMTGLLMRYSNLSTVSTLLKAIIRSVKFCLPRFAEKYFLTTKLI